MRQHQLGFLAFAILICLSTLPAAAGVEGLWVAPDGALIRISACGGAVCGYVSGGGPAGTDGAAAGVQVLDSMRPSGRGKWTGRLYNPKDGNTYSGNLIEIGPNRIRIEGCLLIFCGGETLTRAASNASSSN
jgi:uncharacterized protein (DUF2147 family)